MHACVAHGPVGLALPNPEWQRDLVGQVYVRYLCHDACSSGML